MIDKLGIIDRLAMSRLMTLLPYDCFNYVFSRNQTTAREAADFATEFAVTITLAIILITVVLIMLSVAWLALGGVTNQ